MEEASPSPERKAKVTYRGRHKRRASVASRAQAKEKAEGSDEETKEPEPQLRKTSEDKDVSAKGRKQSSPRKDEELMPPPSTPAGQKPPKTPSSKSTSKAKARASPASSVASFKVESGGKPLSSNKSMSAVGKAKAQLAARMQTPDSPADDSVSVDGESSKNRTRKTEAERKKFLEDDPCSGEVQPHRVFCTMCNEWVELNPKLRYVMRLWTEHRKRCGKAHSERDGASQVAAEDDEDAVSVAPSEKSVRSTGPSRPSARVAMAERKLSLVNDPTVKSFTPTSVECALCTLSVNLDDEGEYNLSQWENHKQSCTQSPLRPSSEAARVPAASPAKEDSVPPPSTASTEATVIGSDAPPTSTGEKRVRDDDGNDEQGQERSVRARTESYRPPQGFMGWVKQPFQSFIRGFREGLSGN